MTRRRPRRERESASAVFSTGMHSRDGLPRRPVERPARAGHTDARPMSREPRPLPPDLGSAFRISTARRAGASIARMRATDLDRPFWGVRTVRAHGAVHAVHESGGSLEEREANPLARIRAY